MGKGLLWKWYRLRRYEVALVHMSSVYSRRLLCTFLAVPLLIQTDPLNLGPWGKLGVQWAPWPQGLDHNMGAGAGAEGTRSARMVSRRACATVAPQGRTHRHGCGQASVEATSGRHPTRGREVAGKKGGPGNPSAGATQRTRHQHLKTVKDFPVQFRIHETRAVGGWPSNKTLVQRNGKIEDVRFVSSARARSTFWLGSVSGEEHRSSMSEAANPIGVSTKQKQQ